METINNDIILATLKKYWGYDSFLSFQEKAIQSILDRHWKVQFWDDADAQKQALNDIDDYLFDEVKGNKGIEISLDQMDEIIERTMQVSKHRRIK